MKIVCFVPAKGSSERIKNKNLRSFNGEPLFLFTLRKLLRCKIIDEVYIDSDADEILKLGQNAGAIPLKRASSLANNKTDGNSLFYNQIKQVEADIYVQHLCTSPFVKEETIEKAIRLLIKSPENDSLFLCKKEKIYQWNNGKPNYDINRIPNSIDLDETISEAMSLYAVKSNSAKKYKRRIGDSPIQVFASPIELIDINNEADLELAKVVAAGILSKEEKNLKLLGKYLTSSLLSDILDEFDVQSVLPNCYESNFSGAKLFGRARTLHIRKSKKSDSENSIYEALDHYKEVVSNDIIVVRNDLPNFAYFGELNTTLALRSGASGALIGGVTRDSKETAKAHFPVFSKGSYCVDIKGRGAIESMNKSIKLDGIEINPSDLVFADVDGIVIIPRKIETEVIKAAIHKLKTEKNIIGDIFNEIDVNQLVKKHGFF